jgi:hypothetical protein
MKLILIVGTVVAVLLLPGGQPANAVPFAPATISADAASLIVPVRHHRHHRHWRHGHSRGWDDDPAEMYPLGVEGQTMPPPGHVDPSVAEPARRNLGGADRPSIRWVDPDRSSR